MREISRTTWICGWLVASLLRAPWAGAADANGAACPVASPKVVASSLASAAANAATLSDGMRLSSESTGPADAQAAADRREAERAEFERILAARPLLPAAPAIQLTITPAQRAAIEQDAPGSGRQKVGTALEVNQSVDFSQLAAGDMKAGSSVTIGRGIVVGKGTAGAVWEIELASVGAKALRLQFSGVDLALGVSLYVYNEAGRVAGPYVGKGPDGSGEFWSASVFGDRVRVQLRADRIDALKTSRLVIAKAMHLGARFHIADAIQQQYVSGPSPDDTDFCGAQVPDCYADGMCALQSNPGLANALNAIAHLEFVDGADTYICTGTLLNSSLAGNGTRPPYLLTANHCISTQPSASSLEAYFHYHTASCNGACTWTLTQINGSALMVTGALPTYADFTLLRLSPIPSGSGLVLLGWTAATVVEGGYLLRLSHPAGAPLAYSLRRKRANNPDLPHCAGASEPTFMYSGLESQSTDAVGAVAGGSSGSAAIVLNDDASDVYVVGQLLGHCPDSGDTCNADTDATVDGAFSASFPYLRRYLVDRIFADGFD